MTCTIAEFIVWSLPTIRQHRTSTSVTICFTTIHNKFRNWNKRSRSKVLFEAEIGRKYFELSFDALFTKIGQRLADGNCCAIIVVLRYWGLDAVKTKDTSINAALRTHKSRLLSSAISLLTSLRFS